MLQLITPFSMRSRARPLASLAAALALALLAGCSGGGKWHADDVTGAFKPLAFTMTRAPDDKEVHADAFKGHVTLLYFGYTLCPDVCPTTLANVAHVLKALGPDASKVRVLFVTVDPNRDSLETVAAYVKAFAPEIVGLRGTPDQLASLARRYRVSYSVKPDAKGGYEVTHSSAIYVFDRTGAARLVVTSLSSAKPDIDGTAADLRRLID